VTLLCSTLTAQLICGSALLDVVPLFHKKDFTKRPYWVIDLCLINYRTRFLYKLQDVSQNIFICININGNTPLFIKSQNTGSAKSTKQNFLNLKDTKTQNL